MWIAWTITRVISGFYSAVRGAQLAARGLLAYGVRHKHLPGDDVVDCELVVEFWILALDLAF